MDMAGPAGNMERMTFFKPLWVCGCVGVLTGCFGELFLLEKDLAGEGPRDRGCSVFNPDGECPAGLRCCDGVCAVSCDAWVCACDPEQACVNGECQDIDPENQCSPGNPDGLCPVNQVCIAGTCVPISGSCGCDPPEQACVDGECIDIPPERACSAQNLYGLCPDGQVCVGGVCLAVDNACSTAHPNGLCPAEATCVNGRCIPVDDRPCGPDRLDGLCPNCRVCQPPGVCEPVLCSPAHPFCGCEEWGDYCVGGQCVCLPCNTGNLSGCCPDDQFCSTAGYCIPDGGCVTAADCQMSGVLCSCAGQCINEGTCYCDSDCGAFNYCPVPGDLCQRDLRCPNGDPDCPPDEYCDSTATCRLDGTCGTTADCVGQPGTFCSACGECIPTGQCCENSDCTTGTDPYCSTANTCLDRAEGECASTFDCPPGQVCNAGECEAGGRTCTANGAASCVDVGGETFWCCPTGDPLDCCPQGFICGAGGTCIPLGDCVDATDCHPAFTCNAEFKCVPSTPCTDTCVTGVCSQAGGCIPDDGSCVVNEDCAAGEVCGALYRCEPAVGCGDQEFQASKVPPNMLVVLDRSGSMNLCIDCPATQQACIDAPGCSWATGSCRDDCVSITDRSDCRDTAGCGWRRSDRSTGTYCEPAITRWDTAIAALDLVLDTYRNDIRFGLSLFPLPCVGNCDYPCHYDYCDGCGATAGTVEVATAPDVVDAILAEFAGTFPGGSTPTAPTLRAVEANRNGFGLPATGDPIARANYILLVTDGDANSGGTDASCSGTDEDDLVNCALDRLRRMTPAIRTFVVGFAFSGSTANLDCHAFWGGTARQDTCAGVTSTTCDDSGVGPCYYPADNKEELVSALSNIASSVASCSYSLDSVPQDPDRLTVYFYHQCSSKTAQGECEAAPGCAWSGGACDGDPVWLPRDRSRTDNWDYDLSINQVVFAGAACDKLQAGGVTPVVILGCRIGE